MTANTQRGWLASVLATAGAAHAGYLALRPRGGTIASIPVAADEYFSAEEIARARRYERPQRILNQTNTALSVAALGLMRARHPAGLRALRPARAAAAGAALSLQLAVLSLPLDAVARKRSLDAGLATQSWRGWGADALRITALGSTFAGTGAAIVCVLMRRFDERWWLVAGAGSVAVTTLAGFTGPLLLEPIFNDFTPLPDGELRAGVLDLAQRAGVRLGGVFSVDASRRTSAVNAYVSGLGATRRVVLFDTLLARFPPAQTRLVVAHELAHVRHRDVVRGLLFGALVAPFATRAVDRLAERIDARGARADSATLPSLVLASGVVASLVGLSARQLSRAIERRADSFALELTDDAEAFIAFEQQITRANLADPQPPRWRSSLLATHPPALERIGAAAAYAAGARPTPRRRPRL